LDWEIKEPFSFPGSKGIDKFREKLFSLKANSFQEKSELLDANNSEMIIKFVPDKIRFKNMPDVELFLGKPQKNGKTLGKLSIGKEYFLIDSEIFQIDPYSFFSESFLSFSKEDFQGLELLRGGKSIKWEFSKGKLSFEEANGKISEVLVKEFNEEKIVIKVDAFSGQHLEEKHFKRSTLLRFQLKSGQKQLYFFTKGRDYFVSTGLNHPVFKLKNPDLFRKIGKI